MTTLVRGLIREYVDPDLLPFAVGIDDILVVRAFDDPMSEEDMNDWLHEVLDENPGVLPDWVVRSDVGVHYLSQGSAVLAVPPDPDEAHFMEKLKLKVQATYMQHQDVLRDFVHFVMREGTCLVEESKLDDFVQKFIDSKKGAS